MEIRINHTQHTVKFAHPHCPECHCCYFDTKDTTLPFVEWERVCSGCGHTFSVKQSVLFTGYKIGEV